MRAEDSKTVLVTGANGFIGSRLCRLLTASGYAVRIICRESSDLSLLKDIQYTKIIADITAPESLAIAVRECEYIIHLAGLIAAAHARDFFRVNQGGTSNLLNAVKNNNPDIRKFVLVSSVAAGGPSFERPRKESDPPAPITTYGRSKLAGEEVCRSFHGLLPITVVRPPAVYGPGDIAILKMFDAVNKGIKPYMAGGCNIVQMVHVDDLCRGIKAAMEAPGSAGQIYYLAEEEPRRVRDLLDIIAHKLGRKAIGIYLPRWLVYIFAFIAEMSARIFGRKPIFSREKVRDLTSDWQLDVSRAREQLDFETEIDFETGSAETIAWYRREGWLK